MTRRTTGALLALLVVIGAVAALAASSATAAGKPIIIGYPTDLKGNMAPFDGPALAAAGREIAKINAAGGVKGRRLKIIICDTQNSNPAKSKACAASLVGKGAVIGMVTCDVEFAAPATQEFLNHGLLTVAPCIGTDQMGPKRFGAKGKLAFSFGNLAQDEGAAMAEWAYKQKGWRTAALATNNLLIYFKNIVQAFDKRFTELGGKIVARESYTTGQNDVGNAVSRLNGDKADVIVTSTSFGELPGLVSGLRSLGNETPILNSWAGDGTYWVTSNPKVTNYFAVTYASIAGDDPSPAVNALAAQVKAGTGGFVTGAAAIDGIVAAIKRAGGSTNGAKLAAQMVKFKKVPTISGLVSFSTRYHSVFGRQYRVIEIQNNVLKRVGLVTASSPADIG
ncbi:MAG: amino acid ABC transporter substrate-binding protein [Actinobacteria bacterium]|nr:MAG: amino acid ABC transporter substrate-binding protein [Actinomycetota bacterium]